MKSHLIFSEEIQKKKKKKIRMLSPAVVICTLRVNINPGSAELWFILPLQTL